MTNLYKLAQKFEEKMDMDSEDFDIDVNPEVVLHEHEESDRPVSYMVYSNLKNSIMDASELLSLMNEDDELPAWADEMLAISKNNINKVLSYVRSVKSED